MADQGSENKSSSQDRSTIPLAESMIPKFEGPQTGPLPVDMLVKSSDQPAAAYEQTLRMHQKRREADELARKDKLTKLLNRTGLTEELHKEISRSRRSKRPISGVMLDIDHFKEINDTYGHPIGDKSLMQLADFLRRQTRLTDVIARYGGEEFFIVLSDTDSEGAQLAMDKLQQEWAKESGTQNGVPAFTLSGGITTIDYSNKQTGLLVSQEVLDQDSKQLIVEADTAVYKSKETRNTMTVYNPSLPPLPQPRISVEQQK